MKTTQLEARLVSLENEVERLKGMIEAPSNGRKPWWEEIAGTFRGDPLYEEAMKLGREYRQSLRPKVPRKRQA